MNDQKQDIGLFGGTFNPVHHGHLSIAESFLDSGFITRLWILLTPDPPHKQESSQLAFQRRLEMVEAVFDKQSNIEICTIENKLPRPSYTSQTVRYLRKTYPGKRFWLCIGEDSLNNFKEWYQWEEILEQCELLVAKRPATDKVALDDRINNKARFISHQPVNISSTAVRRRVAEGKDITGLVPAEVKKIIEANHLYKNKL